MRSSEAGIGYSDLLPGRVLLYVVDAGREHFPIEQSVYLLLLYGLLGMLHPQSINRGVLGAQLVLVCLLGLFQAIAATSLGKRYLQPLFRFLLLHLQDAMFLRGLLASMHLIVRTSGWLLLASDHLAHWHVIVLLANERKMHILEFSRIELAIQTARLPILRGTGIREGDIGLLSRCSCIVKSDPL